MALLRLVFLSGSAPRRERSPEGDPTVVPPSRSRPPWSFQHLVREESEPPGPGVRASQSEGEGEKTTSTRATEHRAWEEADDVHREVREEHDRA